VVEPASVVAPVASVVPVASVAPGLPVMPEPAAPPLRDESSCDCASAFAASYWSSACFLQFSCASPLRASQASSATLRSPSALEIATS
jgi:hypothetical protein